MVRMCIFFFKISVVRDISRGNINPTQCDKVQRIYAEWLKQVSLSLINLFVQFREISENEKMLHRSLCY